MHISSHQIGIVSTGQPAAGNAPLAVCTETGGKNVHSFYQQMSVQSIYFIVLTLTHAIAQLRTNRVPTLNTAWMTVPIKRAMLSHTPARMTSTLN